MGLELSPFCPPVGLVVMTDIAEKDASGRPVDDKTDIAADAHRPEILILGAVELVKTQTGGRRIYLEIEGGRLDRLLLVAGQPCQAVGEGIGDQKIHGPASTSSTKRARSTLSMVCEFMNLMPSPTQTSGILMRCLLPGAGVSRVTTT